MKKIIYSALAVALAFFAASCQQENLEPAVSGNTVTYTVEVPGALKTKAFGDDLTAVDKVYYQVYRAGEIENPDKDFVYDGEADVDVSTGTASFELEFVKNQNFVVLFWAQDEDLQMFDIDDLRAVELTTPGASNNVNAQVFAGSNVVTDCVPANGGKVTLSRPISQLNIFTTKESLKFGTKEITLSQSTVKVDGLYTTYNVAAGEAVVTPTAAEFTYGLAAVPTTQDTDPYAYVAMNYVGFAPVASTTVEVDFTIKTSEGDVRHIVSSVPVKPNYRTNIVGNLLTEAADYDVTLDAAWDDEEYTEVVVSTASDLQTTINEAPANETVEISLSGDINLGDLAALLSTKSNTSSNTLSVPEGKSIVLNLNGYSISGVDETNAAYALIFNYGNLSIVNTADKVSKLTVKATVESGWSRRSAVISTEPKSTLYVGKGVEIEHLGGTSMSYGIDILTNGGNGDVEATIDGAVVKSSYRAIRQFLNSDSKMNSLTIKKDSEITSTKGNKSVWMQDASAKANKGSLVVEDGAKLMTDAYLDVTAGSTAWPVTVSIAASALKGEATVISENVPALYDVVLKDGYWTVETSFTFAEFVDAVIAAEGTYDGEGKTVKILPLSGKSDNTNGCLIPNRLQKYSNPDVYYAQYQRFAELQDVNISNVNFVFVPAAITVQDAWNPAGATTTVENVNGELQFMNSGSVTLTGCTFDKVAVSPINAPALTVADCQFSNLMAYAIKDIKAATVSITGTEFNNCNGGFWFANAPATVTVTDNTFTEVGRRGAIQFSATGDYSNTTLNISGNRVDGIFLWQLNETITEAQLKPVLENKNNTYTTAYTENSIIPVDIAKIGDKVYKSLIAAVAAVEDGETITLVANETFTETNRTHNSGTWYDGLYYIGDKSFTIDLGGFTVAQDGAVNDYLLNFKNDGAKANIITLKNGTVDAGTAAFCALCTSGTSTQKLTINLEDVNLINNISNGSTLKIRGAKTTLNVKNGTKITGLNSYLGIESWQSTINIYDGAEIYMNGTSSYNGCLVGVGGNGIANVYGGYGKGVKGGFIAMTSGGTINVAGGEWIANTDGSIGDNSNVYVLTAQNNKYESGYAGPSIINVTGGTFRGGMDAWILNDVNVEKAELNIKGGNFNANPSTYTSTGYQAVEVATGWTVVEKLAENNGVYELKSKADLFWFANEVNVNKNAFSGKTVKLAANIDLANAVWTPVGQTGATTFNGVFDGQNYTISNLNVDSSAQTGAYYSSGLFGWIETHSEGCGIVKNLIINGATVTGHHNCGALVGYITEKYAVVENCHVSDATITCTYANGDADGDKAGALIGNATVATIVKDCTATDSTVSGGRDSGQLIGAGKEVNVTGCSATNVIVSANGTGTGANVRNEVIGRLL